MVNPGYDPTTEKRPTLYWYPIVAILVTLLSFVVIGPFYMAIDGWIYTAQVEQFAQGQLVLEPFSVALRAFKPFHGLVGAALVPPLTPEQALQLINIGFAVAFPFAGYWFLRELEIDPRPSFWGGIWMVSGYPVLKYGLALATDMGSWVFAILTVAFVLRGLRLDSWKLLCVASLIGFLGASVKETGVIGLIFGGLAILFSARDRSVSLTARMLLALCLPAFLLECSLILFLMLQGFPSFLDWFGLNTEWYPTPISQRLFMFVGVNGSAFHFVGAYGIIGLLVFLRGERKFFGRYPRAYCLALWMAPLIVYIWPLYIGRILYIQILVVVPLALLGLDWLFRKPWLQDRRGLQRAFLVLPVLFSAALFALAGKGSIFDLIR